MRLCLLEMSILPLYFPKMGAFSRKFGIFGQKVSDKKKIFRRFSESPKFRRPPASPARTPVQPVGVQTVNSALSMMVAHCRHDAIKLACNGYTQSFAAINHLLSVPATTTAMSVLYLFCVLSSLALAHTGTAPFCNEIRARLPCMF